MAKHPHKLLLINGKTWKCTLDGCGFFVHLGLTHVLIGKRSVCWKCDEVFITDERALKSDKPVCYDCENATDTSSQSSGFNLEAYQKALIMMREAGVKSTAELSVAKRMVLRSQGALANGEITIPDITPKPVVTANMQDVVDEIEVIEPEDE